MNMYLPLILLAFTAGSVFSESPDAIRAIIINDITSRMDSRPPPLPVDLDVEMEVIHFESLDEELGIIKITFALQIIWTDERLMWDPKNYSGIAEVYPTGLDYFRGERWYPELLVDKPIGRDLANVVVLSALLNSFTITHKGDIFVKTEGSLTTSCVSTSADFPHDLQECSIGFISTLYADDIVIGNNQVSLGESWTQRDIPLVGKFRFLKAEASSLYQCRNLYIPKIPENIPSETCKALYHYTFHFERNDPYIGRTLYDPLFVFSTALLFASMPLPLFTIPISLSSLLGQLTCSYSMSTSLPATFEHTPLIASFAMFISIETFFMFLWGLCVAEIRKRNGCHPMAVTYEAHSMNRNLRILYWFNYWMMGCMAVQYFVNCIIIFIY